MPEPFAQWNPSQMWWETGQVDLFSGRSELYSATWPTSGMTRSGRAYARPRWVPATGESESSSSPGLPTPRAADYKATMGSPGSRRHVQAGNGSLAEVLGEQLLPPPTDRDPGNDELPDPGMQI